MVRPGKKERRAYFRDTLKGFHSSHFQQWNRLLSKPLLEFASRFPSGTVAASYQAKDREADPAALWDLPWKFCFPLVLSRDGKMEFRSADPKSPGLFQEGAFGIQEPLAESPKVERSEITLCFVPLLAFDGEGQRLGQGRGFYDRFLEGFTGVRVGLGFEWQFSPEPLPTERTDQKLDFAITEWGIRSFSKKTLQQH
jgi:5-formyltetrahydrofolate cyclo-ligase